MLTIFSTLISSFQPNCHDHANLIDEVDAYDNLLHSFVFMTLD